MPSPKILVLSALLVLACQPESKQQGNTSDSQLFSSWPQSTATEGAVLISRNVDVYREGFSFFSASHNKPSARWLGFQDKPRRLSQDNCAKILQANNFAKEILPVSPQAKPHRIGMNELQNQDEEGASSFRFLRDRGVKDEPIMLRVPGPDNNSRILLLVSLDGYRGKLFTSPNATTTESEDDSRTDYNNRQFWVALGDLRVCTRPWNL